jgi:adenylyl-sulfate kinase
MNIFNQNFLINKENREKIKEQKSCTIWLTGLSGSGKSTIANYIEVQLYQMGYHTYTLDGDNTRLGLNKDLNFSEEDRIENIRRVSEICKILNDAGIIVISSFISPFKQNREQAKNIIGEENFIEILIDTDISECEQRDVKGLYKKARLGEIKEFTGISSPFEIGEESIRLNNNVPEDIENNVSLILDILTTEQKIKNSYE